MYADEKWQWSQIRPLGRGSILILTTPRGGGGVGYRTLHNMEGQGKGKAISELLKQLYNMQGKAMAMRGGLKPTTASPICKSPPWLDPAPLTFFNAGKM